MTNFNGETIAYDEIGNPIQYKRDTLTWTEGRRLASLSRPFPGQPEYQTIYTYEYNAAGQRLSKTKTLPSGMSTTTEFIYEGDLLVGQKTSDGKGDMTFLHDDTGSYIGLIYEGAEYYYMKNVQGDVIGIVDAEGVIQAVYTYEPFGKLFSIETKSGFLRYDGDWSVGGMNPIRYRGYYYDYDTKLYYLNSRYYDPYVGRFLNADSQVSGVDGDIRGYNLFSYCFNNPINLSDDSGSWPNWATKLIAAVAVVAVVTVVAAVTVATAGAGTAAAVIAVGAAKGAAIGMVSGAAIGAVTGAVNHRVSTGSWNGAGTAALDGMGDGALSGAVTGAITGTASSTVKVSQAAKAWNSGTFKSGYKSMKYHYNKHVLSKGLTKGNNVIKYTQDAVSFANRNSSVLKYTYNYKYGNASWNLTYSNTQGGMFTSTGKIITFWYR